MEIEFTIVAKTDIDFWKQTNDKVILKRIRKLLDNIQESPFSGIGKPEALKHNWTGFWSRKINKEHRLIYQVTSDKVIIHSAKGHYR